MSKVEVRNITIRRVKLQDVLLDGLTDVEMQDIINKMEDEMEDISIKKHLLSTPDLFAYIALDYAMRLYKIEHLEKTKQKAEEKRLDETIKRIEDFLKTS